jgi:DNA repair photolyase
MFRTAARILPRVHDSVYIRYFYMIMGNRGSAAYAAWQEVATRSDGGDDGAVTRYLAVTPRGILNSPAVTRMGYWSINPYIGCEFGCAYCYARDTHRWTVERALHRETHADAIEEIAMLPPNEAFERRIIVKQGAAELLAAVLPRTRLNGQLIMIGTATDPYQPAERRVGLTRALLEVFRSHIGLRIGIISKSTLITRDCELLAELSKRHDVTVNVSLASVDAKLLRRVEARTPVPQARLNAMRALADAGINVGLLAAPILPGITDGEPALRALLEAAKDAGARWATYGPLRMGPATRSTLLPWLERNRPDLRAKYERHYGSRQGVSARYQGALEARFESLRIAAGIERDEPMRAPLLQPELFPVVD